MDERDLKPAHPAPLLVDLTPTVREILAARDAELRQRERQLAALVAEGWFVVRAP